MTASWESGPCVNISQQNSSIFSNSSLFADYFLIDVVRHYYPLAVWVHHILAPIWLLLGLFGNSLCMLIWWRCRASSWIYLVALSVSDLAFSLLRITEVTWGQSWLHIKHNKVVCQSMQYVYIFTQYYSIALVLGFTVERWIAVRYPLRRSEICTQTRSKLAVGILAFLVVTMSLPHLFLWTYNTATDKCEIDPEIEQMPWLWSTLVLLCPDFLMSVCVPLCILCFNVSVIRTLQKVRKLRLGLQSGQNLSSQQPQSQSQPQPLLLHPQFAVASSNATSSSGQRKPSRAVRPTAQFASSTMMLLTISCFMIFTTLPVGILFSLQHLFRRGNECFQLQQLWLSSDWQRFIKFHAVKIVVDEMAVAHYSCNVLLYLFVAKPFRQHTLSLLTCGKVGRLPSAAVMTPGSMQMRGMTNHNAPLDSCQLGGGGAGGALISSSIFSEQRRHTLQFSGRR